MGTTGKSENRQSFKTIVWKDNQSTLGDLVKTRVFELRPGVIGVEQLVLTKDPNAYYEYKPLRTFKGKTLIVKCELHTKQTWLRIASVIEDYLK